MDDNSANALRLTHHFAGPPGLVWAVWTRPELIRSWFGSSHGFRAHDIAVDLRPGGNWSLRNVHGPIPEHVRGHYHEAQPGHRLSLLVDHPAPPAPPPRPVPPPHRPRGWATPPGRGRPRPRPRRRPGVRTGRAPSPPPRPGLPAASASSGSLTVATGPCRPPSWRARAAATDPAVARRF